MTLKLQDIFPKLQFTWELGDGLMRLRRQLSASITNYFPRKYVTEQQKIIHST
uniref:Uncharacterized protein n=1 Tax=Rhizophora mucronata TaxID=61149 RepID=A0A2P2IT75_RHIMU